VTPAAAIEQLYSASPSGLPPTPGYTARLGLWGGTGVRWGWLERRGRDGR